MATELWFFSGAAEDFSKTSNLKSYFSKYFSNTLETEFLL